MLRKLHDKNLIDVAEFSIKPRGSLAGSDDALPAIKCSDAISRAKTVEGKPQGLVAETARVGKCT